MKRTILLFTAAVAAGALSTSALAQWTEGFETYDLGTDPVGQGGWLHWGDTAGNPSSSPSGEITDAEFLGGAQSVKIHGGAVADDLVRLYDFATSGVWAYTANVFIPQAAEGGLTYFILLNNYVDGSQTFENWSTQIQMNPDDDLIVSEHEGVSLPLLTGGWAEIRVVVEFAIDLQEIYYNGQLLSAKSWVDGVSGGGQARIYAVDLWADTLSNVNVYYDDMSLLEIDPVGACCLLDGSCEDASGAGVTRAWCESQGGFYQGHQVFCDTVTCPVPGPCGWLVTAPFIHSSTTTGAGNDCGLQSSEDEQWEVTIPYEGNWTFQVCSATWDTKLFLDELCCTFDPLTWDEDGCPGTTASSLTLDLDPGVYFVTLEGTGGATGLYDLIVSGRCLLPACPPGGDPEPEPCGQDLNGGCVSGAPSTGFTTIADGQTYCGEVQYNSGLGIQDLDWYEIVVAEPTAFHFVVEAEFDVLMGYAITEDPITGDPMPGIGDCAYSTGSIGPYDRALTCEGPAEITTEVLPPGTYWFIVTVDWQISPDFACGDFSRYFATLTTEGGCVPSPDVNGDGCVDVLDLLDVIAGWGTAGPYADVNCDGVVDVLDLLDVIAAWGTGCP